MSKFVHILFCALLALSITDPIIAKRNYGSSYHKPSGGSHRYPSSGGLSGTGQGHSGGSHGYPASGGLSGGGSRYPSNQGYPGSKYPSQGSHGYPSSGGLSGNSQSNPHSNYPVYTSHGSGYQNTHQTNYQRGLSNPNTGHTTNIHHHHHYNYNPPPQIRYTPTFGGSAMSYPVYRGSPPSYVYQYKNSGSKYGTLLAGLALLNLGVVGAGAYALSQRHSNYRPQPGEICKFGLKKDNGDYEETRIDCQLITSFIFQEQDKTQHNPSTVTNTTTTVTNVTVINTNPSNNVTGNSNPLYEKLPNGTLVPVYRDVSSTNVTNQAAGNTMTSTTTTVTSAVDVKGKPIDVTPSMQCYVMRHTSSSNMKRSVPCGLLQTYADKSLRRNSASRNMPVLTILSVIVAALVIY